MEEAKTLVHHALTALFAVLILGAVMSLISLAYMMWSAFSKQDAANLRLRDYAKFSAFDNTDVRGQDIIALLHNTQGSPWVLIVKEKDGDYTPINLVFTMPDSSMSFDAALKDAQNDTTVQAVLSDNDIASKSILTIASNLTGVTETDIDGDKPLHDESSATEVYEKTAMNFSSSVSRPSYAVIQEWFLARGAKVGGAAGYLPYKTYLVYADSLTTEIAGVIVVEGKGGS